MIFTSPGPGVASGVAAVSVGGAIGGFVITGFGAGGFAVRRVRLLRLVCASASITQKLTRRHAVTRILMYLLNRAGIVRLLSTSAPKDTPLSRCHQAWRQMLPGFHVQPEPSVPKTRPAVRRPHTAHS